MDSADGAQVRVAMSVFDRKTDSGTLWTSESETPDSDGASSVTFAVSQGTIFSDLTTGVDTDKLVSLQSNAGLACPGLHIRFYSYPLGVPTTVSSVRNLRAS